MANLLIAPCKSERQFPSQISAELIMHSDYRQGMLDTCQNFNGTWMDLDPVIERRYIRTNMYYKR